jgi:putative MFS transporter
MFTTLAGLFLVLAIVVQFPPETFGQPLEEDATEDEGAIYGH